jgi:hypothetical protein
MRLRVLTGTLRVLRTQLTGGDAKVAVEAWNRLNPDAEALPPRAQRYAKRSQSWRARGHIGVCVVADHSQY